MALVGTLLFCTDCGSILDRHAPDHHLIKCSRVLNTKQKYINPLQTKHTSKLTNTDNWPASQRTTSAPDAFPSRLVDKRSNVQILTAEDRDTWATTQKMCPKCENAELKYRDVQTRGADEGSTVFYKCPACGYGFKEDN